ncbi:aminotransferase-like domain-containing protein [Shouchella clausii]|uniref:aminotransferase-like domain-containing protein n=1 Tax=Shouchella clausii TaxID=79880 RepID=UPI000B95D71A|nr:PLP-dependent aminotransferase family protein [Shouchella clausii]AST95385.1 hypothetical protein BC8716_05030 [Shouchella clausii]MCM3548780.1 PLP-dependent aminotransferase family protein [Shouchella clausii]MEB5471955.1 PLP-dependent aminotransferase family protein [Shouchella clausii]PAF14507.1 hypothetical protein CHH59_08435 [Shouchella clausii]QNM41739.1 PLP-dependent aminotransferase family protein [Shouchella clausii]
MSIISGQRAKIAADIRAKIEAGEWYPTMKLPTQQELAAYYQVNRSTVIAALDRLKARGIIVSIQGKGSFVSNDSGNEEGVVWKELAKWSFYPKNKALVQHLNEWENDATLIQLSKGVLAHELQPKNAIKEALTAMAVQNVGFDYGDGRGDEGLRQALSVYLQEKGIQASPDSILIVSGALGGLQLIGTGILQTGSVLFHEPVSYLRSLTFFASLGIRTSPLDFAANHAKKELAKQSAHALYVNPTHHNPTGMTLDEGARRKLLLLAGKTRMPIIEDDIYGDLSFEEGPKPLKAYDRKGQVLYLGSFSKTVSPGFRIGWLVGPPDIVQKLADLRMQTDYGSSMLSQFVCRHLLETGTYRRHVWTLKEHLRERKDWLLGLLQKHFGELGSCGDVQGGFFIWFTFRKERAPHMQRFVTACHRRGVVIHPGFIYGEERQASIRFSFAFESLENMEKGLLQVRKAYDDQFVGE